MNKDASFLFAGIRFDKKKFSSDFERFKEKKQDDNNSIKRSADFLNFFETEKPELEETPVVSKKRKRKHNSSVSSGPVQGFSVFKTSKSVADEQVDKENQDDQHLIAQKELNRQIERDARLRKKYSIHVSGSKVPSPLRSFTELMQRNGCHPKFLRNFAELGFKKPTPIQRQAIPVLLSGRECFACAPTGSGKTLAFICPMLMKLKRPSKDGIRGLILSPTRELAAQTARESKKMAQGTRFRIKLMTKKLAENADFSKIRCDILISTPLRLKKVIDKEKIDLSWVVYLVLDESDKLFESLFVEQTDYVVNACSSPSIIRSLFSATLPDKVEERARTLMHDAVRVIIGRKNSASESIKQKLVFAGSEEGKLLALRQSFAERLNPPVLIFVQSKERAKELYGELKDEDIRVDVIHADLTETQRVNAVDNFRAGKTWVLIATDLLGRGMDFKGINCVINYDFPDSASAYIHRIGRCGRAGRTGDAITFYTEADIPVLRNIANVMVASGCDVPSWIMDLRKRKWRGHRPRRESISLKQDDDE